MLKAMQKIRKGGIVFGTMMKNKMQQKKVVEPPSH